MKYTLTYKNKQGVEARLDIITFGSTSTTETIEGTDTPFILNYKREKNDKEGYIISSSADIAIYESGTFNIDTLKTSNETDIKVEYYIDNVLTWSGFVVPDFFSRVIGTPAVVNMVASDRLGSLKGQTLSGLPAMVTLSSLVSSCLSKTGLSLPINLKADFTSVVGNENVFASKVISQRFTDTKGRNISCYDILRSILVMTNSVVVQRNGQWYIANKIQIEQGTALPTTQYIDFDEVSVGARRQIMPVASSVGVYHEFGGERKHPQNFDFSEALSGWTAVNGLIPQINNKEIVGFTYTTSLTAPIFGTNDTLPYLLISDTRPTNYLKLDGENGYNFEDAPYLKTIIPIISLKENTVNVNFDVGITGRSYIRYNFVILAKNRNDASDIYALNQSGLFTPYDLHSKDFLIYFDVGGTNRNIATRDGKKITGKLDADNVTDYDIEVRIYPAYLARPGIYAEHITVVVNYAAITFNNETEIPKGNIYKTTQGDNFTKVHETDTTVIGDYRTSGLNGYGYPYPIDDTSSLLTSTGLLTERWTAPDNADELPILQHVTRQRAKMFSIAHDLLTAEIDSDVLDPLATFRDCSGKKYVMVSGSQDFLRGTINVEIEEIAYSTTIWKQDYIYSYFGEGEEGISSVGGISESAPASGGGGMTPEQLEILNNLSSWWKYDDVNDAIYSELSVYSKKEVSAYGLGSGGGGGGTMVTWGDTANNYSLLTVEGVSKNVALSGHKHAWSDLVDLPDTLSGYGITDAYTKTQIDQLLDGVGAGSVTSVGMTVPTGLTVTGSPITTSGILALGFQSGYSIPTTAKQNNWDAAYTNAHTHSNKTQIDLITQAHINVLNKLFIDADGNVYTTENFYSTKEVSAYGLGSGGGGGTGYERLDAWADYTSDKSGWVLSALLGNDLNTRLSLLEAGGSGSYQPLDADLTSIAGLTGTSGFLKKTGVNSWELDTNSYALASHTHTFASLTSKPTTLAGYGITDAANISHSHAGVYEPVFTKNTAFNKNFGTTAGTVSKGNHTHTFASITDKPTTFAPSAHTLDSHSNVTITSNTAGEILKWNGSNWINNTLAEAGIASTAQLANYLPLTGGTLTGNLNITNRLLLGNKSTGLYFGTEFNTNINIFSWTNAFLYNDGTTTLGGVLLGYRSMPIIGTLDSSSLGILPDGGNLNIGTNVDAGYKLNVSGTGRFTDTVTAPKVIFAAAGWSVEQTGTEIQFKYNGVIKQRLLSDGSVVAVGEVTAYGATS